MGGTSVPIWIRPAVVLSTWCAHENWSGAFMRWQRKVGWTVQRGVPSKRFASSGVEFRQRMRWGHPGCTRWQPIRRVSERPSTHQRV